MNISDCAVCKASVRYQYRSLTEREVAPLGDDYRLLCSEGCAHNGWTGRHLDRMVEEWNETQRVLRAAEEGASLATLCPACMTNPCECN